jgi:maltooligosyltrehalose trehalohydrolase
MMFEVWAPLAEDVRLELEDGTYPMARDARGSWRVERPAESGETRYRFSVNGGHGVPDPRSRWQPDGVHGASCVWDTSLFRDRKRAAFPETPLREVVVYEAHVGTFTAEGTYAAMHRRLAYLRDLGVTHLELMPLSTFPGERGWGYDGVFPYAPHPAYGTPEELFALVEACHELGLGVLLDVVYNHFGPAGNYLGHFGPYFTSHWNTPWGDAINFDGPGSDFVRAYVIDNAMMWIRDYGFDGLRLDAVQMLIDSRATHILEELTERVDAFARETGRQILITGESDKNNPRFVLPSSKGGYGLHAHWADEVHHTIHAYFTGECDGYYADFGGLADVARALQEGYVFQGQYSAYRDRGHGRPPKGVRPEQMIVCAQNHDQIGNRAVGDRLSVALPMERLRAIAALVLLSPFTPMLFQGEEWAARTPFLYFTDHRDPELARAVTEGRRREFAHFGFHKVEVPDPQARETFVRSKLDWDEHSREPHAALLEWHRTLLRLRREYITRHAVDHEARFDEEARWLTMRVGRVLTVANLSEHPRHVPIPEGLHDLLTSTRNDGETKRTLPPWAVDVWRC